MASLFKLAYWEALILLIGLFAVVLWKFISGEVALDQLFEGDIKAPEHPDGLDVERRLKQRGSGQRGAHTGFLDHSRRRILLPLAGHS